MNHRTTRELWILFLAVLVGIPVLLWLKDSSFDTTMGSAYVTFKLGGQLLGLVGAQLFAFSLILSSRSHTLEKIFGGLDRMYRIHHLCGVIGFSLLAFHPLFLALSYATTSFADAREFLNPFESDFTVILGMLSLLGLFSLVGVTLYGMIFRYESLKKTHQFLGLAFLLGYFHALLIPSTISDDTVLKLFIFVTGLTGLSLYTYRTLLGKWLVKRFAYAVMRVTHLPGNVTELSLTPSAGGFSHLPGQFVIVSFPESSHFPYEEHPFTISNAATHDGTLRLSVKNVGDFTASLPEIKVGEKVLVEGPFGEFSSVHSDKPMIWVAGGIGITPFASMAEDLLSQESLSVPIDFFYSVRTESEALYKDLFTALATKHPNFTFSLVPSDTKGYVTGELISGEVKDMRGRELFVCGPPPMMDSLIAQCLKLGVTEENVHSEKFALLK